MIIKENNYTPVRTYEPVLNSLPGKYVFFDIETTGLSSRFHQVYLIGATWPENGSWRFRQWFADSAEAEAEVLSSFTDFLKSFDTLVHFNGDTFDIPFLRGRLFKWNLEDPFPSFQSEDLLRRCRPLKKMLGLGSLKLKILESFLGIAREDPYDGGQLIRVYEEYLNDHSREKEAALLLHNEEDVKGMPELLPIFSYLDLKSADFHFIQANKESFRTLNGEKREEIYLHFQSSLSVPAPFTRHILEDCQDGSGLSSGDVGPITFHMKENQVTIRMIPLKGKLNHYFANYKDYFYLPLEDKVIHKSVGNFVDKNFRQKALPEQCFAAKEGVFLRQPCRMLEPAFQKEWKSRQLFFEYSEPFSMEDKTASLYIREMLKL